jgi:uncharacterized membrane protein YfhO
VAFGDHAFLAVELPGGQSEVELSYLPPGFVFGGSLTAATLLAMLGAGLASRRKALRDSLRSLLPPL